MNRKEFFKHLGLGAVTAVVASKVISLESPKFVDTSKGVLIDIEMIPDGMTIYEVIENWHRHGIIFYQKPRAYRPIIAPAGTIV